LIDRVKKHAPLQFKNNILGQDKMADMLGILRDLRQRTGVVTSNQGQNDIINTVGTGLLSQVLTTAVA
jgi:hypothetical protein